MGQSGQRLLTLLEKYREMNEGGMGQSGQRLLTATRKV